MTAPRRAHVLGLDRRRGWRLLHLPDGNIQLDVGAAGLILNPVEFQSWVALLRRAVAAPPGAEVLAAPRPDQCVMLCPTHAQVTIAFGPVRLRLRPADLPELARLCAIAGRALGLGAWRPAPLRPDFPHSLS